jgi:NADPH2:quinone reductase
LAQARRWVATDFGGPEVLELVTAELPPPGPGEVTIEVRAAGMNPSDYKGFARAGDRSALPRPVGSEVAGVLTALGPDTEIASGGGTVGDEVLAFRITGGYFPAAANLLLVGATAADTLRTVQVAAGETVLVHGASGSVGVSTLQQARLLGARVIGTASERNFDTVRSFGAVPVAYGAGLEERVRQAAPDGIAAAIDTVGTDEAVDVSLALVENRDRIVTIASGRAQQEGIAFVGGGTPDSAAFRDSVRPRLIQLAAEGSLVVPVARTYPLAEAREAVELLATGHPGGKLALVPER